MRYRLCYVKKITFLIFAIILIFVNTVNLSAQSLDETWNITVGGQTVQVNPDGSYRISNISSPDQFGSDGPGSTPDFLSDDFLRVVATRTIDGITEYAFSEPFQITNSETFIIGDLTFTDFPPSFPDSLEITADPSVLTEIGETTQLAVTGNLADGSTVDLTLRSQWTIYRTSNPAIATVGQDGLVTAQDSGIAFITAVNEGATAVSKIAVSPSDPLTIIEGLVQLEDSAPVDVADVNIQSVDLSAITDISGFFQITGVPTELGALSVRATKSISDELFVGAKEVTTFVKEGVTDAGIITLVKSMDVGYYDLSRNNGNASQIQPITTAGLEAVNVGDLNTANLSEFGIMFVQNPSNSGYSSTYVNNLTKISDFVENGGVLIFHDRRVTDAQSILPGSPGNTSREFSDGRDIDIADNTTCVTDGPGGILTDVSLDGGNFSNHGWTDANTVSEDANGILSTGDPNHLVTYSYPFGSGWVIYSTIPLDFYLSGSSSFATEYAPNVICYANDLRISLP